MLSDFMERPAIRQAWKDYSAKVKLSPGLRETPCAVPSAGFRQSSVGIAFDYLARFRIAHDILAVPDGVPLQDGGWAADDAVGKMRGHPEFDGYHARWSRLVAAAKTLFDHYTTGTPDGTGEVPSIARVAKCCQYLGAVDLLHRIGGFNPAFTDHQQVQDELLAMNRIFDPVGMFQPRHMVMLKPWFVDSWRVGGADADLIVDGTIIDIKTTKDMAVSASVMRHLAGLAILHAMGGPELADGAPEPPAVESVAIYYSRFGVFERWPLDEILPDGGFARLADAFREELPAFQAEQRIGGAEPGVEPAAHAPGGPG